MDKKGKVLDFVIKENKVINHSSENKALIVDFDIKFKTKEKEDLTSELLDSISYMIWLLSEIYNDMYDLKDYDFIMVTKQIHNAILELENCYEKMKNINIDNIDELLFKLKIMVNQSYYFVSLFDMLDNGEDIDLFELKYYVSLVYLYTEYMDSIIKVDDYDYDDFDGTLDIEVSDLEEVITELEVKNKIEAYTAILTSKTEEKIGKVANELQITILSRLISDTVKSFVSFDVDIMIEYYNMILDKYISEGILDLQSIRAMEAKVKKIEPEIMLHKQYYSSYKAIDDFIVFVDNYASESDAINISNKLDKLFKLVDKLHEDGNVTFMHDIENTIKLIFTKIVSMIDAESEEEATEKFETIFSDQIILNTIYMINNELMNGKIEDINENMFDNLWSWFRSMNINKYLTNIIRREMFGGKDIEFYSNSKYCSLVELEINDIANNAYYSGFNIEVDYIKDDFLKLLDMLKKSFRLEEASSLYKFDSILGDIEKLDYLDYSYTSKYLDMLEDCFGGMDRINLKEFLSSAVYLPMRVKYKDNEYVSVYKNNETSLIVGYSGYYLVSNKKLESINSVDLGEFSDNREAVYNEIMGNILIKYINGKKYLETRKKKNE